MIAEGVWGTVTLRNFRSPTRIASRSINGFVGTLAITRQRLWGFTLFRPVVTVAWGDPLMQHLHCSLEGDNCLLIAFDVAHFHPEGWSGTSEVRFYTGQAGVFYSHIRALAGGGDPSPDG